MGFVMEKQGAIGIETRRAGFILTHAGSYHDGGYAAVEIAYDDLPDLLAALVEMIDQEHLVTGYSIDEYKKVGPRLERQKELDAVKLRGEWEE